MYDKVVKQEAGIDGICGQNPIEWLHFMSKQEINESMRQSGTTHRDAPLTASLAALKGRNIRLYSASAKAMYGEGPFRLSSGFDNHLKSYDEWKDLDMDSRRIHLSRLLSAKRKAKTARPATLSTTKETRTVVEISDLTTDMRTLCIKPEESCIPEESVRMSTLQDIFRRAEYLLNELGAIAGAASDDERMRTVKSRSGGVPLIVQPANKKSNLFTCQCPVFKGIGLCADTVAVADVQGLLFEYLAGLHVKFLRKKSKKQDINITSAVEAELKISEK